MYELSILIFSYLYMALIFGVPFLLGYLIGSIPFGLVLCKLAGYGDIRTIGSGNIGATNVLRTGNKALALATLILDSGKGAIAVMLCLSFMAQGVREYAMLCGVGAVFGHCFPIWLGFKGGKGVATTLGTLLAALPFAGLAACGAWLIMALISRISSLSALTAFIIAPIAAYFLYSPFAAGLCFIITVLVFFRHRDNIKRILRGEEPKIGDKKKQKHDLPNAPITPLDKEP